ncbi:MAG: D-alanine--D-alanine ligase [Gammaproteobacteria bacterium]|nr:D-alanine--D-alanine ligase [Gammaproteobacteria bacterium]MCI0590338.1 D-alanine--D-alanine ligase [Gammaproteobacteria bacterium]
MQTERPVLASGGHPVFSEVAVILGDSRLPDSSKRGGWFNPEDLEAIDRLKHALASLSEYRFNYVDNHGRLLSDLIADAPRFVLNLCDTGYRNLASHEPHIPALLELLEIPYSGAGPVSLAVCRDKALVRSLARVDSIPVPAEIYIDETDPSTLAGARFPALLKPNCADGSFGITREAVVYNAEQARGYIDRLPRELRHEGLLLQEFLTGTEYSVGVIGNPEGEFTIFPLLEVDYSDLDPNLPQILAHEAKTDPDSPYWTDIKYREADLDRSTRSWLTEYAQRLFVRLNCRDYARIDFRADAAGNIKLLEVNPNPAWCWDGKLALMAGYASYSYSELLQLILQAAQHRIATMHETATGNRGNTRA